MPSISADSHAYWNFPLWESSGTGTTPMVASHDNVFNSLSLARLSGKPFFVSEWDQAWPDEWRAESPLAYAAVAAFQGWSGVTIHTYRYNTWDAEDRLGGGAETINSITYRNHFDASNDPAKFGLFYHAALLLRRGDVQPSQAATAVQLPGLGLDRPDLGSTAWLLKNPSDLLGLRGLPELQRLSLLLPDQSAPGAEIQALAGLEASSPVAFPVPESQGQVTSDTGELWRSWHKRYATIDTPRTKAAYGFLAANGPIYLQGLALEVATDFAVIALSSLTDDPLHVSSSILLTAVGRCDNTDAQYDPGAQVAGQLRPPPGAYRAHPGENPPEHEPPRPESPRHQRARRAGHPPAGRICPAARRWDPELRDRPPAGLEPIDDILFN